MCEDGGGGCETSASLRGLRDGFMGINIQSAFTNERRMWVMCVGWR